MSADSISASIRVPPMPTPADTRELPYRLSAFIRLIRVHPRSDNAPPQIPANDLTAYPRPSAQSASIRVPTIPPRRYPRMTLPPIRVHPRSDDAPPQIPANDLTTNPRPSAFRRCPPQIPANDLTAYLRPSAQSASIRVPPMPPADTRE